MRNIDAEIERKRAELADLEKQKKEFEGLTSAQKIAEILHSDCHWSHDDQCSWHYDSWTKLGHTRRRYLEKAAKLLVIEPDVEHLIEIICLIKTNNL